MADRTPTKTIAAIDRRDAVHGRACVLTGSEGDRIVPQHRQGGMGGRKDKHAPARVLWIDSIFNGLIEHDPEWQAIAMATGVKLWSTVDPERVPVWFRREQTWFVLEGDGRREVSAPTALEMMLDVYGDRYLLWKAVADQTDRARALYLRAVH